MLPRICSALLLASLITAASAAQTAPASFGQRLGEIISIGGTSNSVRDKLVSLSREATTLDEQLAIESYQMIVRGLERDKRLHLGEAEQFAAKHPQSRAALLAVGYAALREHKLDRASEAYLAAVSGTPWLVEAIRDHEIDNLVGRLASRSDGDRLLQLGRTFFAAGWTRGSPSTRSYLASIVIQDDLRAGRTDHALGRLRDVTDPELLYALMADKRFAAIRPEIERSSGPRLEKRWLEYLNAYRDDWMTAGTGEAAEAYAFALQQANHHQVLVDQFLPRFVRGYNCWQDPVARRLAGYLVTSLTRLGRETKAQDVLRRAGAFGSSWSGPSPGSILLSKGEYDRAAKVFELSLKGAEKLDNEISPETIVLTRARLACANHQRGMVAQLPATDLLSLSSRLWFALCVDDPSTARSLLLAAFANEDERLEALQWIQPFADPPVVGSFARTMNARVRALQTDPQVLAVAGQFGLVHDWTLESSAPPEASMRGLPVRRASPCSAMAGDRLEAVKPPDPLVEGIP